MKFILIFVTVLFYSCNYTGENELNRQRQVLDSIDKEINKLKQEMDSERKEIYRKIIIKDSIIQK